MAREMTDAETRVVAKLDVALGVLREVREEIEHEVIDLQAKAATLRRAEAILRERR